MYTIGAVGNCRSILIGEYGSCWGGTGRRGRAEPIEAGSCARCLDRSANVSAGLLCAYHELVGLHFVPGVLLGSGGWRRWVTIVDRLVEDG